MKFNKVKKGIYENDQYRIENGRFGRACLEFTAWKLTRKEDGKFRYFDTMQQAKDFAADPIERHFLTPKKEG